MTVHILHDTGFYVVVRCNSSESESVLSILRDSGFRNGKEQVVDGIPSMVDINVTLQDPLSKVDDSAIRSLLKDKGFEVA